MVSLVPLQAVTTPVIEPLIQALSTPEGWIGLLLGLGGRETAGYIRRTISAIRGSRDGE